MVRPSAHRVVDLPHLHERGEIPHEEIRPLLRNYITGSAEMQRLGAALDRVLAPPEGAGSKALESMSERILLAIVDDYRDYMSGVLAEIDERLGRLVRDIEAIGTRGRLPEGRTIEGRRDDLVALSQAVDDMRTLGDHVRSLLGGREDPLVTALRLELSEALGRTLRSAEGRPLSPEEIEMERAFAGLAAPRVRGRKRPTIEGPEGRVRMPRKGPQERGGRGLPRLDAEHLHLLPGEDLAAALARIRTVIGRRIVDTPLQPAWEAARAKVLAGRSVEELGSARIRKDIYPRVRNEFWNLLRRPEHADAKQYLVDAGFVLTDQPAPLLDVRSPGDVPVEERRISLDHSLEKAIGENWRRALDADNLVFEFHNPNSYREIIQRRHRLRDPQPPEGG